MAKIESEFKIGEIVEVISTGVKLRIEKFYESFLTGREINYMCDCYLYKKHSACNCTTLRITEFDNIKKI